MASLRIALALLGLAAVASGAAVAQSSRNPAVWPLPAIGGGGSDIAPYIIGGEDADVGEFPHQLSMQVSMFWLIKQHICGATIINEQWALTAGHCVKGVPWFASAFVLAGKVNLGATEAGQQKVAVRKMFVHEKYAGGVGEFDLGLLHLKAKLVFSDTIQPVALPSVAKYEPTGDGWLSGWGYVDAYSEVVPKHLQKLNLPVVAMADCIRWVDDLVSSSNEANPLVESNICLGVQEAGQGVCNGDSGGPMIQLLDGVPTLLGVASWTFTPCQKDAAPSVYTNVAYYLDWIQEKIQQ